MAVIKSTISSGKAAGVAVALGILVGDAICVSAAIWGGQSLFEQPEFQWWIALLGGVLVLLFGVKYLFFPSTDTNVKSRKQGNSWWVFFLNGFIINFFNPFVFAVWFGFAAYNRTMYSETETTISLLITLITIFATDVLKAFFSERLGQLISGRRLLRMYRVFGFVMIVFAVRLLFYAFSL